MTICGFLKIKDVPHNFDEIYLHYAREGSRVLCLGYKELGQLSHQELRDLDRSQVESGLQFAGFVIISCPLKPDSKSVIREIQHASHHITMITGDNPLTACHVGSQLKLIDKKNAIVLTRKNVSIHGDLTRADEQDDWCWKSICDDSFEKPIEFALEQRKHYKPRSSKYPNTGDQAPYYYLCLTGEGLEFLSKRREDVLKKIIGEVKVFARVSPKQKEFVITMLKSLGYVTLMCGDGTNDVGALKHAEVGVALLSNSAANSEYEEKRKEKISEVQAIKTEMTAAVRGMHGHQSIMSAQVRP